MLSTSNLLPSMLSDIDFIETYIKLVNEYKDKPLTDERLGMYDLRIIREAPRVSSLLMRAKSDIFRETMRHKSKEQYFCKQIKALLLRISDKDLDGLISLVERPGQRFQQLGSFKINTQKWVTLIEVIKKHKPSYRDVYDNANLSRMVFNKYWEAIIEYVKNR